MALLGVILRGSPGCAGLAPQDDALQKKREAAVSGGLRYRGAPHWLGRLLSRSLRTPFSEGRGNSGTAASRACRVRAPTRRTSTMRKAYAPFSAHASGDSKVGVECGDGSIGWQLEAASKLSLITDLSVTPTRYTSGHFTVRFPMRSDKNDSDTKSCEASVA